MIAKLMQFHNISNHGVVGSGCMIKSKFGSIFCTPVTRLKVGSVSTLKADGFFFLLTLLPHIGLICMELSWNRNLKLNSTHLGVTMDTKKTEEIISSLRCCYMWASLSRLQKDSGCRLMFVWFIVHLAIYFWNWIASILMIILRQGFPWES